MKGIFPVERFQNVETSFLLLQRRPVARDIERYPHRSRKVQQILCALCHQGKRQS